ncbi:MAG: phospho-N-acetylmuramoyl-pentapeptide-transferase [Lentisphaerae bacterium]|nr:phospho-N-acetylmuramoyl-pentapeptide-transferase [Lentisphaerota bacterium]
MFYYLHLLENVFSPLRVFQYVTVRAFCGAGTSFLISLLLGPVAIRWLRFLSIGQYERKATESPLYAQKAHKEGTPTMGGFLIIASMSISVLLWAQPGNALVALTLATLCYMGLVGFWDDYMKTERKQSRGMRPRGKLLLQIVWGLLVACVLMILPETTGTARSLMVPFLKDPLIRDLGVLVAALLVIVVVVGASNAVNLTDGLDGLAIGCSGSVALSYLILAYVAGHFSFASYLRVPYISGSSELAVFCGCMLGSCLGFLWFNCHPAHMFMGDTGSLALGGAIGVIALAIKQEVLLMIVGGVFVIEAASVIIQVLSFKLTGKRVFAMAPIHHHFEMRKWSETQVTVRFWILSIICALIGVLTLKIR